MGVDFLLFRGILEVNQGDGMLKGLLFGMVSAVGVLAQPVGLPPANAVPTAADKAEAEEIAYVSSVFWASQKIASGRSELLLKKNIGAACIEFARAEVLLDQAAEAQQGGAKFGARSGGYFDLRTAQGLSIPDQKLAADYDWVDPLDTSIKHTLHTKAAALRFAQDCMLRAFKSCRSSGNGTFELDELSKAAFDVIQATGDAKYSARIPPKAVPMACLRGTDID